MLWRSAFAVPALIVGGGALFEYYHAPANTSAPEAVRAESRSSRPDSPPWTTQPGEHPLAPALRWVEESLPRLERIEDLSADYILRERVAGVLGEAEHMRVKIRHKPFSVYLRFIAPASVRGREVLYVEGANDGNLLVHLTGASSLLLGTISLNPDSTIARSGYRYPLTDIGPVNLLRRLAEVARLDVQHDECEVRFFNDAKINGRPCTCLQVTHPARRSCFRYHVARTFVDKELNLPIRFECYDWPKESGDAPELMEEYTYLNVRLNNGFSDKDFSTQNPECHF